MIRRLLRDSALGGAWNMAVDRALAELLPPDTITVRSYGWSRPTLSLGRNEPFPPLHPLEVEAGIERIRRPTGGRSVLHHEELTFAVLVPLARVGGPRPLQRRVGGALLRFIEALGVPLSAVRRAVATPTPPVDAGPCFEHPSEGELSAFGRKLIGTAQARVGGAILLHGSIPLRKTSLHRSFPLAGTPAFLEELLTPLPAREELESALALALFSALDERPEFSLPAPLPLSDAEVGVAMRLEAGYLDPGWVRRR